MTPSDLHLLFEYDRWANSRVLTAISALSPEQFTRNLGGSFPSVRDTFVHIVSGEWIWLMYWKSHTHGPDFLASLRQRRDALFAPELLPDAATVGRKWAEIREAMTAFIEALTEESINKPLPFRTTHVPVAHLMQHVANHSTYHRGQISLMMRQLGAEPVATDFHVFLAEGR